MPKTRIGLDVDNVIADFTGAFKKICRKRFGKPGLNYQPGDWDWTDSGLNKEQWDTAWRILEYTPNFWLWHVEPLPYTSSLTEASKAKTLELFFISSRTPTSGIPVQFQTEAWLQQHFNVEQPQVFIIKTHADNSTLVQELSLNWFLDDKPQNCEAVLKAIPSCKTYLHKARHNRNVWEHYPTVNTLNEFLRIVEENSGAVD